jgi:hypothetical protein
MRLTESINWTQLTDDIVSNPHRTFDFRTETNEQVRGYIKEVDGYEVFLWIHREPIKYAMQIPTSAEAPVS